MTNAELIQKIRAEIERLKGQLIRGACAAQVSFETSCKDEAYNEILSFLSTLESEKPINQEGLEEEIERYLHSLGVGYGGWVDGMEDDDLRGIARHFAEWGYLRAAEKYNEVEYNRQRAEESGSSEIPNDLQKYASRAGFDYVDDIVLLAEPNHRWNDHDVEYAYRDGFIAGAKRQKQHDAGLIEIAYNDGITIGMTKQKEQMLKEAIQCEVFWYEGFKLDYTQEQQDAVLDKIGAHDGDKVRIVIVKED